MINRDDMLELIRRMTPASNCFARTSCREDDDYHEFCPRCEANLTLQKGYDPSLPYWTCLGCGKMLINPAIDSDIAWICDGCGTMLNVQQGFAEDCGVWKCTECGFDNRIDPGDLYLSEAEYQAEQADPYKGLSDEAVIALASYVELEPLGDKSNIILIKDPETDSLYVKKVLDTYDISVYKYIKDHPIEHMPRIVELFEGDNALIVIEEYIDGRTIEEIVENAPIAEGRAIEIICDVCSILDELHSLDRPIIHRDVKPSNVIITSDDEVYLLDMNVAKWYAPEKNDDTRYMGTQYYAAPEQVGYGLSSSSTKADIYAVGMLLNVMLTGEFPKEKKAEGNIWPVIERCISLDPEKRYTAKELILELEKLRGA